LGPSQSKFLATPRQWSWVNNLMAFKKIGLEKIGGLGLVT